MLQDTETKSFERPKKVKMMTYGCQMNVYDSQKMNESLALSGYSETDDLEDADLVVMNTCHIREKAAEKVYSELGRIKQVRDAKREQGKDLVITVAGCVGQAEGEEIFRRAPYVDIVVGPQSYQNLSQMVSKIDLKRSNKHLINLEFPDIPKFDSLPETRMHQGSSAFLTIQEGCDKFCHFCVVSYTRGAEYSRAVHEVYREALQLVNSGAMEITLLGQNVNAYHGVDPDGNEVGLGKLIELLSNIEGLKRIRYTTSHPSDMEEELIIAHGTNKKLMPFLHLPIQSGSNRILKAMNRKHTREFYLAIIARLKASCPEIALSTDFIVGYPGETEADFEDTMDILEQVRYSQCYSFKYSKRPGTPAANLDTQVAESVKARRLEVLQKRITELQKEFNNSCIGLEFDVLFDRRGKFENQLLGKSPYMQSVYVEAVEEYAGKIARVKVTDSYNNSLKGSIVE